MTTPLEDPRAREVALRARSMFDQFALPASKLPAFRSRSGILSRVIPFDEIEDGTFIFAYLATAADIISSLAGERPPDCSIYLAILEDTRPVSFACHLSDEDYVVAISPSQLDSIVVSCCFVSSIKDIAQLFNMGNIDPLFDVEELVNILRHSHVELDVSKNLSEPNLLILISFGLLVLHEYAHIIFGHLKFLEASANFSEFFSPEHVAITRQTLELDADCLAIGRSLKYLFAVVSYGINPHLISQEHAIAASLILNGIMFSSINTAPLHDHKLLYTDNNHPASLARFGMTNAHVFSALIESGYDLDTPEVKRMALLAHQAAGCLQSWRSGISLRARVGEGNLLEYSKAEKSYADDLERRWNRIRPILTDLKITIGNLAPLNPEV